jgi:hypothetical protein
MGLKSRSRKSVFTCTAGCLAASSAPLVTSPRSMITANSQTSGWKTALRSAPSRNTRLIVWLNKRALVFARIPRETQDHGEQQGAWSFYSAVK